MPSIKPFNCYCVQDGPTYSGTGSGTGSGGGSGGSGYPTNSACNKCTDSVTPLRYTMTWNPVADCAGDWANTEYSGPFTLHNSPGSCFWNTTEKGLNVDNKAAGGGATDWRVYAEVFGSVLTVYIKWYGVAQGADCTNGTPGFRYETMLKYTYSFTTSFNCLGLITLTNPTFQTGLTLTWRIGPLGIRYRLTEPIAFPSSVTLQPAM